MPSHSTNPPALSAIVAMSDNRVIGKNNQLPWHLPADLKHFKTLTTGHAIIMGRKTYESIGKALPNRLNIILTRNTLFHAPGCHITASLNEAIQLAHAHHTGEIFIIGGVDIYTQCLPQIQRLYLTLIHHTVEDGDAYFPLLDNKAWQETSRTDHNADENNAYAYSFICLERLNDI